MEADGGVLVDVYFHTVLFPAVQMADGEKWTMLHNLSSTRAYPPSVWSGSCLTMLDV
jgi:hypothetical protein